MFDADGGLALGIDHPGLVGSRQSLAGLRYGQLAVDLVEIREPPRLDRESRHGNLQFWIAEAMKGGRHRGCLGAGFEAEMMVNLGLSSDLAWNSAEDCDN